MIILIRIATFAVFFIFFLVVVYFGICIVGGAISGVMASGGNSDPQNLDAARQAGGNFVRHHLGTIVLSSIISSIIISAALSFTGILPWCRNPRAVQPPPVPPMPPA